MRLFVAVWPPTGVVSLLVGLPRPVAAGAGAGSRWRWTTPDQWHVTLLFLGEREPGELGDIDRALRPSAEGSGAVASLGPAVASLGPAVGHFGRRVLQVPVTGLEGIAAGVRSALARPDAPDGPAAGPLPFRGHLTLARARGRGTPVPLPPGVVGTELSARWVVEEVTLVASSPGRHGTSYEVVGRYRLGTVSGEAGA
ncbi:MAG: 2'-5' RNA ligase family protein [Acidimicrobiales bacterium]